MGMLNINKPSGSGTVPAIVVWIAVCFLLAACDLPKESMSEQAVVRKKIQNATDSSKTPKKKDVQIVRNAAASTKKRADKAAPIQTATAPPRSKVTKSASMPPAKKTKDVMPAKKPVAEKKLMASLSTPAEKSLLEEKHPPLYSSQGRIDPFVPLIKDQASMKKKIKKRIPRTPLERMALSQMKLVAIIRGQGRTTKALVEEATGKGYIVSSGTYIGLNGGRITTILKDRLLIEEEVENVLGKIVKQKRELKLRKPAGEL